MLIIFFSRFFAFLHNYVESQPGGGFLMPGAPRPDLPSKTLQTNCLSISMFKPNQTTQTTPYHFPDAATHFANITQTIAGIRRKIHATAHGAAHRRHTNVETF